MTENELTKKYPPGHSVTFGDGKAVTQGEDPVLATGVINGEAWEHEGTVYVPIFTTREGREPTTVMVHASNILTIERP